MKDPKSKMGDHERMDAGESEGEGSTDGRELNKYGKPEKGGGYVMKGGKLCKMEKSLDLDADDLEKSIRRLEAFTEEDIVTRKEALLEKARTDDLNKAEQAELFQILGGAEPEAADPTTADEIVKSFSDSEPLQKAIDVSDYLKEQHEALEKSLRAIGDEIQKSDNRRHEFAMLQARALVDIGNMVKSLAEQVGFVNAQPTRGPKSRGVNGGTRRLEKSFAGGAPEGDQLNRREVLDTLSEMNKSMDHAGGERLDLALTKYESTSMISPKVLKAVREFRIQQQASAH